MSHFHYRSYPDRDVYKRQVQTSCGFGVPLMELIGQRDTLLRWAESKDDQQLQAYRAENNAMSIDGLVAPLGEE